MTSGEFEIFGTEFLERRKVFGEISPKEMGHTHTLTKTKASSAEVMKEDVPL